MQNIRRFLGVLLLALLAAPLRATWSIILIDTRTGEIAIASATCLVGFDLPLNASVVVVGYGAAAAQSFVDFTGTNRQILFTQLRLGTDPAQILAMLAASDLEHQTRQYGIVDTQGRAIGFSGTGDGAWAGDLIGRVGTIVYAVQGNVLTGQGVITAAELHQVGAHRLHDRGAAGRHRWRVQRHRRLRQRQLLPQHQRRQPAGLRP